MDCYRSESDCVDSDSSAQVEFSPGAAVTAAVVAAAVVVEMEEEEVVIVVVAVSSPAMLWVA